MNDYEKAEECLKIIKKYGDLYDVIALKEGVKDDPARKKYTYFKANLLLFSRILYSGVMIYDKIKSIFIPVEKVKEAQEQLRNIIGVKVDIVVPKSLIHETKNFMFYIFPNFTILYENDNACTGEYVASLKRIFHFSELHKIKDILLKKTDLSSMVPEIEEYLFLKRKEILKCINFDEVNHTTVEDSYDLETEFNSEFVLLDLDELRELIQKLETVVIDKQKILSLSKAIADPVIKNAVNRFLSNGNLKYLKMIIGQRLTNLINCDNYYKDSVYGKIFEKVEINGKYVNVAVMNEKGEIIHNFRTTLYDYLKATYDLNFQKKYKGDYQELLQIASLYLYLYQSMKKNITKSINTVSFYDYVYARFQERKKHKIKKIPGLYTKKTKMANQFCNLFMGTILTTLLFVGALLGGMGLDAIEYFCFGKEDSTILESVEERIFAPYVKSVQYEIELGKKVFVKIRNFLPEFDAKFLNMFQKNNKDAFSGLVKTGDVNTLGNKEEVVATVIPVSLDEPMPKYYATNYAYNAIYDNGMKRYYSMQDSMKFSEIEQVEALFKIQYSISKEDLLSAMSSMKYHKFLEKVFYPIGDNYVITNIIVSDEKDPFKRIEIYKEGTDILANMNGAGTLFEVIQSIENPQVCCTYGISKINQNSFVKDMSLMRKTSYIGKEYSSKEIKSAVIKGLGLKEDATDTEAFEAIKNKLYSLTPIKDANLSSKLDELTEIEFYETIASLDSLVCNLSTMLATGIDDELIYTFGYFSNDNQITDDEKHAWAMTKTGEIVDLTPNREKDNFVSKVFDYGMKNYIPTIILIAFASYINYKLFGKKIKFSIAYKRLEKTLECDCFEDSYARIKEAVYGGIHIPVSRDLSETVKIIEREFGSFTLQELKDLKMELKQTLDKKDFKISSKLIAQMPFIREYEEEIQKIFRKRKKL